MPMMLIRRIVTPMMAICLFIPIQLYVFNFTIKLTLITIFALSFVGIIGVLNKKKMGVEFFRVQSLLVLLSAFFAITPLRNGFKDGHIVIEILVAIFLFFATYQLVGLYKKLYGDRYIDEILRIIIIVGVINSVFMVAVFLSPGIGDFLYAFIKISDKSQKALSMGMRVPGLFYSGFSSLSVFYAAVLMISIVYFSRHKNASLLYVAVTTMALLLGIVLSGRTGQLLAVFGVIYLQLFNAKIEKVINNGLYFKVLILSVCIVLPALWMVDVSQYEYFWRWAFEYVYNYIDENEVSTKSTTSLFGVMYFLPENSEDIVLGTGNFGKSGNLQEIHSDVGYIRFIYGVGIVGLLFAFSVYLYILYLVFSKKRCDKRIVCLLSYVVFSLLIGNFKDYYYLSYAGYGQILFVLLSLYIVDLESKSRISKKRLRRVNVTKWQRGYI
jgi:hypothetical protein